MEHKMEEKSEPEVLSSDKKLAADRQFEKYCQADKHCEQVARLINQEINQNTLEWKPGCRFMPLLRHPPIFNAFARVDHARERFDNEEKLLYKIVEKDLWEYKEVDDIFRKKETVDFVLKKVRDTLLQREEVPIALLKAALYTLLQGKESLGEILRKDVWESKEVDVFFRKKEAVDFVLKKVRDALLQREKVPTAILEESLYTLLHEKESLDEMFEQEWEKAYLRSPLVRYVENLVRQYKNKTPRQI
jgi:hypothetical protein